MTMTLEKPQVNVASDLMPLRRAVRLACRLTPQRALLPIASHVLLQPRDEGGILVSATNLDSRIEIPADAHINAALAVPARLLSNMLNAVGSDDVELRVDGFTLHIRTETLELRLGGSSAVDFPPAPALTDPLDVNFDREAFVWTSNDCAPNGSRPILTGVCINAATGAMVASDGFRLRMAGEPWYPGSADVVVQRYVATHLPQNCAEVMADAARVCFKGEYTLLVNRVQGSFPNFSQLIPKETAWRIEGDRAEWLKALAPVLMVSKDGSGIVRLFVEDGSLYLSARAEELGEAKARLGSSFEGQPRIAINGRYLYDALMGCQPSFTLEGKSDSDAAAFRHGGRIEIVMPMFVQW